MILKLNNFETDIMISDQYVRVLEICDRALFGNMVQSIYCLCNGINSKEYMLLLDGEKEVEFAKEVHFERDILGINFNDRKILAKLYAFIKGQINLDIESRQKLETYFRDIFNVLDLTLIDLPFEVNYDLNIEVEDILKLFNVKILTEELSFMEKVLCFLDLMALLDLSKLIIFCNLKSFFKDCQIEEIYKHILNNKLHVLLIEGRGSSKILSYEKKNIIDNEFEDYEL